MEEKEVVCESQQKERLYTEKEVKEIIKRRVQRSHSAFFARYGVEDLKGLDKIVEYGYAFKDILKKEDKINDISISLDELVGLNNIKAKINRLAAMVSKNKEVGIKLSMNYVFLGNPGTGKTVAARALAKVFFDKGIIKENKLVEVDRTTLIGEYTGQTAPKVKKAFEDAIGGVLFIDEAYSLTADKNDSRDYCHEVLMVLNKMMEDYRGQLVVIFAGYKDETLKMLDGNRGLKSRINSYLYFEDYSNDELKQIINLVASKYKYTLDEEVQNKLIKIVESKRINKEYANAREIRNIIEGMMEFQAERTIEEPWDRTIALEDLIAWQIENKIVLDSDIAEA